VKKTIVFIASLGAREKKAHIFEEITSSCPGNDYSSVLYLTPTAFGEAEARRQFFYYLKGRHRKTTYIPFHSISLRELCINLYEHYGEKAIIPEGIEPLLLCEIMGEKNLGYAVLLAQLLSKLRNYILNVDIPQIKEEIKKLIFEEKTMKRALKSLETLELYEKRLEEGGLIDFEGALREGIPLIKEHLEPELLVLDGFFDPTPLELKIIEALIEKAQKSLVLLEEEAEFLRFFEAHLDKIEKRQISSVTRREGTGYYVYPSMEDEVEGIARGVKRLILEGKRAGDIIVTFPQPSVYLPMLKRVFQKHAIPLSIAQYDLSNTRALIALLDMITSIEEDYPRNDFLSFLTSPHFPQVPQILREWAVSYSRRAGIIKGKTAWLSMRDILLNSTEVTAEEEKLINEVQRGINSVIDALEKLRETEDLTSFIDEIERLLHRFGFWDSLIGQSAQISETINKQFTELRYFSGICGRFKSPEDQGFSETKTLSGMEAIPYLRHLLKGLKGRDEGEDGVRVVPYEFAAGLESEAMFFGGMIEGDFPYRPDIDPLLPERVKEALGMPFLEYYLDRQKRYFRRLLNVSKEEPYFSYPSMEGDKVFLPSPFLEWGKSLIPPALNIPSEEEILLREGMFRRRDFRETLLNGQLQRGKEVERLLKKHFGKNVFISVTDIDAYRRCPLRFYIEKVLGFEAELPPRFEVEARLWGRLAHKTMEYLYRDGDIELKDIPNRIMEGLELAIKSREIRTIGDFWSKVAREIFLRLIPMIETQEEDIKKQGFSPYVVEKTIKTGINGLRLKGKIDRVDRKIKDKRYKIQDTVILLDYKTGSIDKDSLQLPLYALMWQKENKGSVERVGFYSLRNGSVQWYPAKGKGMEEFIEDALQDAFGLLQRLRKGVFTPIPFRDKECRYCYHGALCRGAK